MNTVELPRHSGRHRARPGGDRVRARPLHLRRHAGARAPARRTRSPRSASDEERGLRRLHTNSHRYVEAYYATAMLGGVFVPVNYRAKRPELEHMLRSSEAQVLFVGERYLDEVDALRDALPALRTLIGFDGPRGDMLGLRRAPRRRRRARGRGRGRRRRRQHPHVHERHDVVAERRDAPLRRLLGLRHRQRRAGGRDAARRGALVRAALPHRRRHQHDDDAVDGPEARDAAAVRAEELARSGRAANASRTRSSCRP